MQLARIVDIPWAIGAGFAEMGFTLESFTISCAILRCSCGWGRLVCVMTQLSHSVGRRSSFVFQMYGTGQRDCLEAISQGSRANGWGRCEPGAGFLH